MLSKLLYLGGVADNICQRIGANGRWLFPLEPTKKSKIFIPTHLLIKSKDVSLYKGKMRIKSKSNYSDEVVDFFHYYQDNVSWGSGGKEIEEFFENGLKDFSCKITLKFFDKSSINWFWDNPFKSLITLL